MARRTLDSIKREQKRYKGLAEGLFKLKGEARMLYMKEGLRPMIEELRSRAWLLDSIVEMEEKQTNLEQSDFYYESLEKSDNYFANLTREKRDEMIGYFNAVKQEDMLEDPLWHMAFSAFMSTESLGVDKEAQAIVEQRKEAKEAKENVANLVKEFKTAQEKFQKRYPDQDGKKLNKELEELEKEKKTLKKTMEDLGPLTAERAKLTALIKAKTPMSKKEEDKFSKDRQEATQRKDILNQVYDLAQKNKETLQPSWDEYKVAKKAWEDKKKEYEAAKETTKVAISEYEKAADAIVNASEEYNLSETLEERVNLTKKNIEINKLQIRIRSLRIENPKKYYVDTEYVMGVCGDKEFKTLLTGFCKDYDMEYSTVRTMKYEDFFDLLNNVRKKNLEKAPELYAKLSEKEKEWWNDLAGDYEAAIDETAKLTWECIERFEECGVFEEDLEYKSDAYREKVGALGLRNMVWQNNNTSNKYAHIIPLDNLEELKEDAKKADADLEAVNKAEKERQDQIAKAQKEYEDFLKTEEYKNIKTYDDANKKHSEVDSKINIKNIRKKDLQPIKELARQVEEATIKAKEVTAKVEELSKADDTPLANSMKKSAKALYDQRDKDRGNHKNTPEYERMIKAVEDVANWTADSGISKKEALANMSKQANEYLKAKNSQWFHFLPSVLRKGRFEYAKAIMQVAQEEMDSLDKAGLDKDVEVKKEIDFDAVENDAKTMEDIEDYIGL